jgi:hypothetical protein
VGRGEELPGRLPELVDLGLKGLELDRVLDLLL